MQENRHILTFACICTKKRWKVENKLMKMVPLGDKRNGAEKGMMQDPSVYFFIRVLILESCKCFILTEVFKNKKRYT